MATTAIAKGKLSKLLLATEASFGVPPAAGYKPTYFYTHSLRGKIPLVDDPIIGAGLANGNDASDPTQGLTDEGGDIDVPLDLNHFGYWLKLALGAPTTTGTTNYVHAFASGQATLPTGTVEIQNLANDFRQHTGLAVKSLGIDISDAPGTQHAKLTLIGRTENPLAASAAGTPGALAALDSFPAALGLCRIDGVAAGSVLSARMTLDTGAAIERYVDADPLASAIVLQDDATFTGELRLRYQNTALETKAIGKTPIALELEWSKSASKLLNFAAPRVFLEPAGAPINGPGGMEATFTFRSAQTALAGMLSATLKNQIASY